MFGSPAEVDYWFTPREKIIDTFVVEVRLHVSDVILYSSNVHNLNMYFYYQCLQISGM